MVLVVISPLSFFILFIWVLSHSSCPFPFFWVWLKVYQFCWSFQEPASGFIDLIYCVLSFYIIYFYSNLYYFLPSAGFELVFSSFSHFLRYKIRLLIWNLSFFNVCITDINFSRIAYSAFHKFWYAEFHFYLSQGIFK